MTAPALRNVFVHRTNGTLVKITSVDVSYAAQWTLDGRQKYSIPIADYDTRFAKTFRPATIEDLAIDDDGTFRAPANAAEEWGAGYDDETEAQPLDTAEYADVGGNHEPVLSGPASGAGNRRSTRTAQAPVDPSST